MAYAGFFFLLLLIVVSMLMGALLFGVLTLGWLLNIAVVLSGLGALWLWGRDRTARQPVTAS